MNVEKPFFEKITDQDDFVQRIRLLSNPEALAALETLSSDYPYWTDVKYRVPTDSVLISPQVAWWLLKLQRNQGVQRIILKGKSNDISISFNYYSKLLQYMHEFDRNYDSLESVSLGPKSETSKILENAIMEESISSSIMEGAVTTRKAAKDLLRSGSKPKSISEKMIVNNYRAMQACLDSTSEELTPSLILKLHQVVTSDTLDNPKEEGAFRVSNDINVIDVESGEIVYIPPDHTEIPSLIESLCRFVNEGEGSKFIHPVLKASLLHFLIGYLHPFSDGNGRTARTLFYWYMLKSNYALVKLMPISRVLLKLKSQYSKAFLYTEYDMNDATYFISFSFKVLRESFDDLKHYLERKQDERTKLIELTRKTDLNNRQLELIKKLSEEKITSITLYEYMDDMRISYQTARNDLFYLVKLKLLQLGKSRRPYRFFKATGFESKLSSLVQMH